MADDTDILRIVVEVVAERNAAVRERDAARADVERLRAELDAARARIAKLEQEPPMALVDFGVGLDLQGIRDDLKFLDDVRRENQQLRAERDAALKRIVELDEVRAAQGELLSKLPPSADQLVMAEMDAAVARTERDAARAEVAEAKRLDGVRLSQIASLQEIIRNDTTPAGVEVARFRAEVERLRADLREAIRLLGEAWSEGAGDASWSRETFALLAKHKEATDG